jgi:hypothetical protein
MLTIRREQMEVLSAYMRQSFEDRMVRHLTQSFPAQFKRLAPPTSGDETVRALIRQGIGKAASYDITSERDVGRFIEVMVAIDPRFDEPGVLDWARQILREKILSPPARMDLIYQRLKDEQPALER